MIDKIIFNRQFCPPNAMTFTIKPIKELVNRYVGDGVGWADPFAGDNSPAEFTNDLNPSRKAKYHLEAQEFSKLDEINNLNGVLFDPPYSHRQISEHYKELGKKATQMDTSFNFYYRVIENIAPKIKVGGYALSFGWNSNGFGKKRGFEIVEILLVPHGMNRYDTICTVERKVLGGKQI